MDAERRPRNDHFRRNPGLVGAEIGGLGAADLDTTQAYRLSRWPSAQLRGHFRMVVQLGLRRDEEQREAPRPGADVDAELDPVGVDQRKTTLIGEKVDVEVILSDRRQGEALLAPREVGFTELDRTW